MHWPNYDWIAFRRHPKTYTYVICRLVLHLCALPMQAIHLRKKCIRLQVKSNQWALLETVPVFPNPRERDHGKYLGNILNTLSTSRPTRALRQCSQAYSKPGSKSQTTTLTVSHQLSPCLAVFRHLWPSLAVSDPSKGVIWTGFFRELTGS